MSKFNVGDRVRIRTVGGDPINGEIGTVKSINSRGTGYYVLVDSEGYDSIYFSESELEAAELAELRNQLVSNEDAINHPAHYTAYKGIEVIQLTEQLNFNRGNVIKYTARAGLKNKDAELEDLKKAAWYLQREIERISSLDS